MFKLTNKLNAALMGFFVLVRMTFKGCASYFVLNVHFFSVATKTLHLKICTRIALENYILKRSRDCLLYTKKETDRVLFIR